MFSMSDARSWNSNINLSLATALVYVVATTVFYDRMPPLFLPSLAACGSLWLGLGILWINKKSKPACILSFMPLYTTLVVVANVLYNHQYYIQHQEILFMPYIGIKILIVALALAAPTTRWVGWLSIGICGIAPSVQYYLWPLELQQRLPMQEPWITTILAIASIFLYAHRCRVYELMRKEEQAEALRRYSQLLLSAQHLLNTPLQVIELSTSLITKSDEERKMALTNIQKSMQTIRHLNDLLAFEEVSIRWDDLKLPGSIEEFEKSVREFKKLRDGN